VRIVEAFPGADVFVESRADHIGKIIRLDNGFPVVVCGKGVIVLTEMYDNNGIFIEKINFRSRFT
jgi:hypothetical protein